jgi:hypothetical protein
MKTANRSLMFVFLALTVLSISPARDAFANAHPKPRPDSLPYLDQATYIRNMAVRAHIGGDNRRWKMQMMNIGERRFLFQGGSPMGDVIEVTDPLNPVVVNENAFLGNQFQLAYNSNIGKWILISGAAPPLIRATEEFPHGKYDEPDAYERVTNHEGLRGVRLYDASDPYDIRLLSEFSTDLGDPDRGIQTGGGTHRDYYDGGKYAYLDTAPDDTFVHQESPVRVHTHALMVVDVSDPESPRHVSSWWVPGQRADETEAYEAWREYGDGHSFTGLHGPYYVPQKVENGGSLGFSPWGSLGMLIHDLSDIEKPKLLGRFQGPYKPGAIQFHSIDVARLDRGFVVAAPETLNPDCNEPYHDTYIVDVSDPANPRELSVLPKPTPPEEAPYDNFCQKRGRFGPHNAPHVKAPGKADPDFTCYTFFNAGLQCYDISDPQHPFISSYFIPPQGGSLDEPGSYTRNTDNVFVEWDRKLIWAATDTGLYLLTSPELGDPVLVPTEIAEWNLAGLNEAE